MTPAAPRRATADGNSPAIRLPRYLMKLLDRHILREIVPMFLFGVIAFTTLVMGGGVFYQMIRFAIDYDVSFFIMVQVFLLKLPEIVAYTLPMSSLFCVLLGFNRLSSDLEITAMKTAGISFFRLMVPVLIFGFFVSLAALMLRDQLAPVTNMRFNFLERMLKEKALQVQQHQNIIWDSWNGGEVQSILYAKNSEGYKISHVYYFEMEDGEMVRMTMAKEAINNRTSWLFKNGTQILFSDAPEPTDFINFTEMSIILEQGMEDRARRKTKVGEYTYKELGERIDILEERGNADESTVRQLKVDFYSKLSIPFASFAFVFIAAPLGLKPQRASSSVGLGVSVIIIFVYYVIQQLFRVLGQSWIDPLAAAWIPNIILCSVGAWLVYSASK